MAVTSLVEASLAVASLVEDSLAASLGVASFIVIKALAIESTLVIKPLVVAPFDLQEDFEQLLGLVLHLVSSLVLLLMVAQGNLK